ncbi:ribosomal maturation YjgA family protein [Nonlabens ulvanivorans]|uniref:Uncharacterized protein DUF2809 n=2 Tax=Nonlabens ulvanivorans TaxID=906888 RepID=A0A084JZG5_NONUL|nr:DUF2809 domain-containing protein [Nonlabens ulvanivorans]KEZ94349.1 hypothetical protein IL45_01640 [Nonlabens ulvanivorans]PRX12238.1 uncharacterized protein DUF2809 [Nonlabens ulvanivorans]
MRRSTKRHYAILTIVIFLIEVFIALYINDSFIRPFLGDVLVVGLIYCAVMAITSYRVVIVAIGTLIFSYMVELAQYAQVVDLLGLSDNKWARIIIGTSFSWWDMVCYTIGFIIILLIEKNKRIMKISQ